MGRWVGKAYKGAMRDMKALKRDEAEMRQEISRRRRFDEAHNPEALEILEALYLGQFKEGHRRLRRIENVIDDL